MKNFFNSKSVRERVLMAAFLLIAVVTWGTSLLGRTRLLQIDYGTTVAELTDQVTWLKDKAQVDERTKKVTGLLDPSRTLNSSQAYAEVKSLAQEQGLQPDITVVRPVGSKTDFSINSFQVNIRQTGLDPQVKFYRALSAKAPYLGIEAFSFSTNRGAPGLLTISLRVYSVEVLNSATKS